MAWKIALALLEIARLLAAHVAASNVQEAAEAKAYLAAMEKANAAIKRAGAARDRARAAGASGVRAPNKHSRD